MFLHEPRFVTLSVHELRKSRANIMMTWAERFPAHIKNMYSSCILHQPCASSIYSKPEIMLNSFTIQYSTNATCKNKYFIKHPLTSRRCRSSYAKYIPDLMSRTNAGGLWVVRDDGCSGVCSKVWIHRQQQQPKKKNTGFRHNRICQMIIKKVCLMKIVLLF